MTVNGAILHTTVDFHGLVILMSFSACAYATFPSILPLAHAALDDVHGSMITKVPIVVTLGLGDKEVADAHGDAACDTASVYLDPQRETSGMRAKRAARHTKSRVLEMDFSTFLI